MSYFMKLIFDNFILADDTFAKALKSLKTCVLVNDSLCGKLVWSLELPITFDERFKGILVTLFFLTLIYSVVN